MISVKRDFESRVVEVELYIGFIDKIISHRASLLFPDGSQEQFSNDLTEIFKANVFLILYNLSESSIKNAIEEIYESMKIEQVSYDALNSGIKREIIAYLKKNINPNNFVSNVQLIATDIIINCFDASNIFSGNLDARKIKSLAGIYGFSHNLIPFNIEGEDIFIDSNNLLTVKSKRNDLAHGIYSFKECGRNYTIQDLGIIKNHVVEYLRQIITNIELFITNKEYLD